MLGSFLQCILIFNFQLLFSYFFLPSSGFKISSLIDGRDEKQGLYINTLKEKMDIYKFINFKYGNKYRKYNFKVCLQEA